MTQQFRIIHGHPDGDLMTSLLAYHWFYAAKEFHRQRSHDWKHAWKEEVIACTRVGLIHHVMHSIWASAQLLSKTFESYKDAFPQVPKTEIFSPTCSTLLVHSVWIAFFDRCLIRLPTGEHMSPQYGGAWTFESSSLTHFPTAIITSPVGPSVSMAQSSTSVYGPTQQFEQLCETEFDRVARNPREPMR